MRTFLKILVWIITASGYMYFIDRDIYAFLIIEDGVVESLTALTLLTMSVLVIIRMFHLKRGGTWLAFNILMAVGFFFGFGEEISWGQRIFSIEAGEFFQSYNAQSETNLHNLEFNGVKINKLIFSLGLTVVFSIYFIFFGMLFRRSPWFRRLIRRFGVPVPRLSQTLLLAVTTALILAIPDSKKWELWEAVFVLVLFLVLLNPFNEEEKLLPNAVHR